MSDEFFSMDQLERGAALIDASAAKVPLLFARRWVFLEVFGRMYPPRVKPKAVRGRRGKRARRQAFYDRARTARMVQRLVRALPAREGFAQAYRDALVTGTGHWTQHDHTNP